MISFDTVVAVDSTPSSRRSFPDTRRESSKAFFARFNARVASVSSASAVCSDVATRVSTASCAFASAFGTYGVVRMLKVGTARVLYLFCDCSARAIEGAGVDGVDGAVVYVVARGELFGARFRFRGHRSEAKSEASISARARRRQTNCSTRDILMTRATDYFFDGFIANETFVALEAFRPDADDGPRDAAAGVARADSCSRFIVATGSAFLACPALT